MRQYEISAPNIAATRESTVRGKFRSLYAYDSSVINDEESVLLYDFNTKKILDFPYWNYEAFELDMMSDDECQAEFRFYKNDVYNLKEVLNLPEEFICYNGLTIDGTDGLFIFLKRFAFPCRYLDMIPRFARPVPQLCMTSNLVMDYLYTHWNHLLTSLNQPWLSPDNLENFANATFQAGSALENCFGLVDETVRPVSRPGKNQRVLYNGHKKFTQ